MPPCARLNGIGRPSAKHFGEPCRRSTANSSRRSSLTSERKIRANRANAQASTGPKTTPGRARAARNSLRHGLSLPVYSDPVLSKEVEALARKIIESNGNAKNQGLAHRFAEAQIDIR